MAQLMPLSLNISCFSKSRLVLPSWFYVSGVDLPGWSRTKSKRAVKQLCMCVCVSVCVCSVHILLSKCMPLKDPLNSHLNCFVWETLNAVQVRNQSICVIGDN